MEHGATRQLDSISRRDRRTLMFYGRAGLNLVWPFGWAWLGKAAEAHKTNYLVVVELLALVSLSGGPCFALNRKARICRGQGESLVSFDSGL